MAGTFETVDKDEEQTAAGPASCPGPSSEDEPRGEELFSRTRRGSSASRLLNAALVAGVLFALLSGLAGYSALRQLRQHQLWVLHTHEVLHELEATLSSVQEAETGQRGFLITGRDSYLEPYYAGLAAVDDHLRHLQQLVSDNPLQEKRVAELAKLVQQKTEVLQQTLDLRRQSGEDAARSQMLTDHGKAAMDALRRDVGEMRSEEDRLLQERTAQTNASRRLLLAVVISASLLTLFLFVCVRFLFIRDSRATEAVRTSEARFRSVLDNSRDVVYRFNLQTDRYEYISPSAEAIVGYTPDELMALDHKASMAMVHPDDLPAMRASLARLEDTGEGESEYRQRTREGDYRWISNRMSVIKDSAGRPLYRDGNIRDITERKRAEAEALSEGKSAFVALANFVPQFVWMCTPDGLNIYFNQRWVDYTGLTLEESYGRGWNTPFHPDDKQAAWDAWNHAVETGEQYYVESRLRAADGSYRWFLMRGDAMRHAPGGVVRWFGTCTDIDDMKRESEGRFRSVLDNSRDVVYRFNLPSGRYEYISPSAEAIVGFTADELMALDPEASLAMVHPDDLPAMRAALARAVDTGQAESEYRQRAKDGNYRWLSNRMSLIRDRAGRPQYRDGNIRDVTEHKRAEAALRESEEEFRVLAQNLISAVALIDARGEFSIVNKSFLDMFDLDEHSKILNVNSRDWSRWRVFDENGRLLDADEHPVRRAVLSRTAVRDKLVAMQTPGHTDFKWLLVSAEPILDAHGDVKQAICTYHDVTHRKQAEEALRSSQQQLQAIIDGAPDVAVFLKDLEGRFLTVNTHFEEMLGITREDVREKTDYDFTPRDQADRVRANDRQVLTTGKAMQMEEVTLLADGKGHTFLTSKFPLFDAGGKPYAVCGISADITERKQMEDALRESEERFRALATTSSQVVYRMSPDWRVMRNLVGKDFIPDTEAASSTWVDRYIPEEDRSLVWATINEAIRTKSLFQLEHRVLQVDGSVGWTFSRAIPLQDANGEILEWFGTASDITGRKHAEEALRESEIKHRDLSNSIPAMLWATDAQGVTTYHNRQWYEYTGQSVAQGYGDGWKDVVFPDDLDRVVERWRQSGRTGEDYSIEYRIRRAADGAYRWHSVQGRLSRDEQGKPLGWFGTLLDIHDRRQAEDALRDSQERMAAIVGSAMDAVITIGADQRVLVFNAAAESIFGCPAAEAIGQALDRFIPEVFREAHRSHIEGFAGSGTTSRSMHSPGILSGLRANGEVFPLEATISQVTVSGEKLCTVILRDLTQRMKTEQALIRSEKLASVGRMAATISHEINNPLEAVTNLLFLVKGTDHLPESARLFTEMADAELKRIAHITRQSLGFYREFSAPAPTSVNGVLESAIDLLKNKIKAKQAVIEKQLDKDVEITAIAGELRQVFANLLGNSLDAIAEKGIITVRVSACTARNNCHRRVRVTIADNGKGIEAAAQQHIFEPFFTTKGALGTGLGLWVSTQIVDKHGGTIRLRSSTDEKHRGTVFSIILPAEPG